MHRYSSGAIALILTQAPLAAFGESYPSYVQQKFPTNVYWGDMHLHTSMSVDAYGMGNTALTPEVAYRFAKGEVVTTHTGMQARLQRPLDFLAVADHAESLGIMPRLAVGDVALLKTKMGKQWHKNLMENPLDTAEVVNSASEKRFDDEYDSIRIGGSRGFFWDGLLKRVVWDESIRRSVWEEVAATADRHNEPGTFTAFNSYEWTSTGSDKDNEGNLHRVVVFKDNAETVTQILPFSAQDSLDPADLWRYMEDYERETGGEVLAIPHNGNVSNGEMYALRDFEGQPLTRAYAHMRARWEPLLEVTQSKGDSETHPILSPTDEFADYETWNSWSGWTYEGVTTEGWESRKSFEYARSALKLGLDQQAKLGVNPFKYGMIGGTDSHTSLSTSDDDNYWGYRSLLEPSKHRLVKRQGDHYVLRAELAAAGYTALWATENTREALFAAMERKEAYASTGPRIMVRFFGGWEYAAEDALRSDIARIGYAKGVPMGGDLALPPNGKAPTFLIRVVKDPVGANLDRVQLVKGWRSHDGNLHEVVYNVALSDDRQMNRRGQVKPVGNTVDVENATYANSIGDPEFAVVWTDPDFRPNELAFYYLRVLQIPTPRWSAHDAKFFALKDLPEDIPMITQERAYTSPIWYTPHQEALQR